MACKNILSALSDKFKDLKGKKNVLILLERENEHSTIRNEIYLHSSATTNRIHFSVKRKEKIQSQI